MRVDKTRQDESAVMVDNGYSHVFFGQILPVTTPEDDARVINNKSAIGKSGKVIGGLSHERGTRDVEDVTAVSSSHFSSMTASQITLAPEFRASMAFRGNVRMPQARASPVLGVSLAQSWLH